jgi:hypothetical protein
LTGKRGAGSTTATSTHQRLLGGRQHATSVVAWAPTLDWSCVHTQGLDPA